MLSIIIGNEALNDVDVYNPNGSFRNSFASTFDVADGLAVGDIDGDSADEIAIANDIDHQVHFFTAAGQPVGFFLSVFDTADGFALGDVDDDERDEIVIGNDLTNEIVIYDGSGAVQISFDSNFDTNDGFAVGDVNGDGFDEIIVANNVSNDVDIYDQNGDLLGSFDATFNLGDGFAAGDVNGDGIDEIVIASITAIGDDIFIFNQAGTELQSFNGGFDALDRLAVGEVTGDFTEEILVANDASNDIEIFNQTGGTIDSFNSSFDGLDEFAVSSRNLDVDQDGIPDRIELNGLFDTDGNLIADFPAWGADPCRKSVAVEIDYMDGAADGHTHRPLQDALDEIVAAFNAAPVPAVGSCPYAGFPTQTSGVNLLVDVDDALPEQEALDFPDFNVGLDDWGDANMDPERRPYFHYGLFAHDIETGSSVSGRCCGESGKDFVVTLGRWTNDVGSVREQSGTFMHELGHALGLGHGGGDGDNYKPNYLSVMNYNYQTVGITNADTMNAVLDYSRVDLASLDETALDEPTGIGAGALLTQYYDSNLIPRSARGDGPIDWDFDTAGVAPFEANPPGVSVDVNRSSLCVTDGDNNVLDTTAANDDIVVGTSIAHGPDMTCDTAASGDDGQAQDVDDSLPTLTTLNGYDDWANLRFRAILSPDAGVGLIDESHEITFEESQEIRKFWGEIGLEEDRFELNDTIASSTILGSLPKITLRDLTIRHVGPDGLNSSDVEDVDFFKYRAQDSGKLIVNIYFDATLGDLDLQVRDVGGNIVATASESNLTTGLDSELLVIPVVTQQDYFIEVFSGVGDKNAYDLEIENFAAPVPISVLLDRADDTGRHNADNITAEDQPRVFVLADLSDFDNMGIDILGASDVAASMPGAVVEVFVAGQSRGFADPVVGSNSAMFEFTFGAGDLSEGLNVISAAVRIFDGQSPMPADGRAQLSVPLLLTLDTIAPTGTVALHPDSDTGIWGFPATMMDGITTDKTPLLYGATEADAVVRVSIDGVPAGTTVAVPLDGNEAFPPPPEFDGNYLLQTILPLGDGEHTIAAFFRDVAGNESPASLDTTLAILLDTVGPRITNVTRGEVSTDSVVSFDGVTSLFEPKPSETGPDPLVHSIVVHFSDLPDRSDDFAGVHALFMALAEEEGNYSLRGDHNGYIAIVDANVSFTTIAGDGLPETAAVELVFDQPLPDDRYSLWVSQGISDPAGNALDGESGALGPFEGNDVPLETPPIFPTGDGGHGGDFHGRFTIDSRPEIGTYAAGTTYLDINGNSVFDPEGQDNDYTNRDISFVFGFRDDRVFAGNFAPAGAASASGFDKLGAYGNAGQGSAWRWRLDFDHDGVVDLDVASGVTTQGDPVAGNFAAAHPGDEIGLFNAGKWWLDAEGDNNIGGPGDTELQGDMRGLPLVGDFDGDGQDDLATWNAGNAGTQFDGVFSFDLAVNGFTGDVETTIQFDVPGVFQKAVAADMNADGIDDLGLFVTRREGVPPEEAGEWFFLISDDPTPTPGAVTALDHPFTPVPFGTDLFAQFGDEAAGPVVGNFDPPTSSQVLDRVVGDFDGNGLVAQGDLDLVLLGWGQGGAGLPPGWVGSSAGDMIGQAELDAVLLHWGQVSTAASARPPAPAPLMHAPAKGQAGLASKTSSSLIETSSKVAREVAFAGLELRPGLGSEASTFSADRPGMLAARF